MSRPLVSVVVPCYNAEKLIVQCVDSLVGLKYRPLEIIIVDDQSTDKSLALIENRYPKGAIKIIRNPHNFGPSRTRNLGINRSRGKYIAFFETDMKADPKWINNAVSILETDRTVGGVHSRVFDLKKSNLIQADGMKLIPHTGWVIMQNYGKTAKDSGTKMQEVIIGSVGTVVRRKAILEIGGYDEVLGHKVDDIDMGWRLWLAGYRSVCEPKAITYHWGVKPRSARPISTLKAEIYFNRMFRVFIKNYDLSHLLRYLPWLLGLSLLRAGKHLLAGNFHPAWALLISIWWTIATLNDTLDKRRLIQGSRKYSDNELFKRFMVAGSFPDVWKRYVVPLHVIADNVFATKI